MLVLRRSTHFCTSLTLGLLPSPMYLALLSAHTRLDRDSFCVACLLSPGCDGAMCAGGQSNPLTGPVWGGHWVCVSGIVSAQSQGGSGSPFFRNTQDAKHHFAIILRFCQPTMQTSTDSIMLLKALAP